MTNEFESAQTNINRVQTQDQKLEYQAIGLSTERQVTETGNVRVQTNNKHNLKRKSHLNNPVTTLVERILEGGLKKMRKSVTDSLGHFIRMEKDIRNTKNENNQLREMISKLREKNDELEREEEILLNNKEKKMCHECGRVVSSVVFCTTECHENYIK